MSILIITVIVTITIVTVNSFATHLTRDYCDREIAEDVVIMGKPTVLNNERVIVLYQNGQQIDNRSLQNFNNLTVRIEPKSFQVVYEIRGGGKFVNGLCDGTRSNSNSVGIVVPDGIKTVEIVAIWAKSYSTGVQLCPTLSIQLTDQSSVTTSETTSKEL